MEYCFIALYCYIALYCTVLCCIALYCVVLCYVALYCIAYIIRASCWNAVMRSTSFIKRFHFFQISYAKKKVGCQSVDTVIQVLETNQLVWMVSVEIQTRMVTQGGPPRVLEEIQTRMVILMVVV